jgi:hypothetical protein
MRSHQISRFLCRYKSTRTRDLTNAERSPSRFHEPKAPIQRTLRFEQFYRITRGKSLQVEIKILGSPHEHSRSILTPKPLGHLGGRREGESEANLGSRADLLGRSPRLSYPSPAGCVAAASCPRAWCGETRRPAKKTRGDSSEEERN